jgi:hypothetical protein
MRLSQKLTRLEKLFLLQSVFHPHNLLGRAWFWFRYYCFNRALMKEARKLMSKRQASLFNMR